MQVNNDIMCRPAQPADLAWCAREDDLVTEDVIQRKIDLQEIFLAESHGEIIGYLRLEYLWSTIPFIGVVFVEDDYQRKGAGRTLLHFVEAFLRDKGHKVLLSSSSANEPAPQAWHRAVGFTDCGIITGLDAEGGVSELFFRKSLV